MAKELFDGQHDDEEILMVFRRHPIVMRWGLIAILIGILIGMIPITIWPDNLKLLWYVLGGMGLGGLVLFYQWISWYFSIFIVSDQRLIQITQSGLFKRTVVDVGLDKILSINYQVKGLQATLLGFGTIQVQTFLGDLNMDKIHKPQKIQEKMIKTIKGLVVKSSLQVDMEKH